MNRGIYFIGVYSFLTSRSVSEGKVNILPGTLFVLKIKIERRQGLRTVVRRETVTH